MINIDEKIINKYIEKCLQVKLHYFDEIIYCQILKQSKKFILIRNINDWHYDGYMILNKKYISNISYSKLEKFREKILQKEHYSYQNNIIKINIDSFNDIFKSLKEIYNEICIEGNDFDNFFIIGKITKYDDKNLYINKLNTYAVLSKKEYKLLIKNISCIFFKDEYSKKLFLYMKKQKCQC